MCLNFSSNFAATVSGFDCGGDIVGRSLQPLRFSGFDFVTKQSSLTISDGRKTRRRCPALLGPRFNHNFGETSLLEIAANPIHIVIAMRSAR